MCHPTPLQPHEIVKRIRETGTTILLSTDTFISQYARAGDQAISTRCGSPYAGPSGCATRRARCCAKNYAIELLEGYGVTEAAPVIAANQPEANRPGTVGRLMAGMKARLEPVEGIPNAGRLFVKGPNVMLGYIKADKPGIIQPPEGGWHDTGDVVSIDDEGFIAIKGRLKRFAKIGGETVSLAVVEASPRALARPQPRRHRRPDGRKGEQIVLMTTNKDANRTIWSAGRTITASLNWRCPGAFCPWTKSRSSAPAKTDYVQVEKQVKALAAAA
ncbi:MAG: AMP-binding protein [Rhizomicrobium sp.]